VFGRDVRSREEVEYSREFVGRERGGAERGMETLAGLERVPGSVVDGEHAPAIVRGLYEQHLIAKRWNWRLGLLEGAGNKTDE
jgi:hypothetical protein